MHLAKNRLRTILIGVMLGGITLAAFWPVIHNDFIIYDDAAYVTENPRVLAGLTWRQAGWAFRTSCAGNWHPLTVLSHMLDVQLFGLNPAGHHLTSLLLHAANAVLLFLVLRRATQPSNPQLPTSRLESRPPPALDPFWLCAMVAGLFALHPLRVESVAWVAERKDVLSAFFFLLTLWAYVRNAEGQTPESTTRAPLYATRFYVLALVFFALALMSKAMVVTLPFILLLLDYWPLRRLQFSSPCWLSTLRRLLLEKLPFFALTALFTGVAFLLLRQAGATQELPGVGWGHRLVRIFVGYEQYLAKTIWPVNLALPYPRLAEVSLGLALAGAAAVISLSFIAIWHGRRRLYAPVGWFWFLGMLIPVIGLVGVGAQTIADRYTYLPSMGLSIVAAWGLGEIAGRPRLRLPVIGASVLALAALLLATRHQLRYWQSSEALFRHALTVTDVNPLAHSLLASVLAEAGELEKAETHCREARRLMPDCAETEILYARVLARRNKFEEAIAVLSQLLRHSSVAPEAHFNLGAVFGEQGAASQAMNSYRQALALKPDFPEAYFGLAALFTQQGDTAAAIEEYYQGLRRQPDAPEALNNLAWIRAASANAAFRNGEEAVRLASRACELSGRQNPLMLGTLAAAYAEAGRFDDAVATAQEACNIALAKGQGALAKKNQALLELYQSRRPYHESLEPFSASPSHL